MFIDRNWSIGTSDVSGLRVKSCRCDGASTVTTGNISRCYFFICSFDYLFTFPLFFFLVFFFHFGAGFATHRAVDFYVSASFFEMVVRGTPHF